MSADRIKKNDLVLIRRQSTFENGSIFLVSARQTPEAFLTRLYSSGNNLVLTNNNPGSSPLILKNHEVKIIGKVIKVSFTLEETTGI